MSRGLPVVVLDDPAQSLLAPHLMGLDESSTGRRGSSRWRGEVQGRVRPLAVEVVDVLREEVVEVGSAEDDEVVEALGLNALEQPLHMGVEIGRSVGQGDG